VRNASFRLELTQGEAERTRKKPGTRRSKPQSPAHLQTSLLWQPINILSTFAEAILSFLLFPTENISTDDPSFEISKDGFRRTQIVRRVFRKIQVLDVTHSTGNITNILQLFYLYIYLVFCLFSAALTAYGGSHARGQISCCCQPIPQPHQHQIRAVSATYTTAHGNAGSLTHWQGQGSNPQPHSS